MSTHLRFAILGLTAIPCLASAAVVGFTEDFVGAGNNAGFFSGATLSNPGTGGVGGAADGYLVISRPTAGQFAAASQGPQLIGNLTADGVTGFSLYLNDVGTDENFAIHIGLGSASFNFWVYTPTFTPLNGAWSQFFVDITNAGNWTQVQGSGTFAAAMAASDRFHIRQDAAPIGFGGDTFQGDLGVDRINVVPEPATFLVLAPLALLVLRRKR